MNQNKKYQIIVLKFINILIPINKINIKKVLYNSYKLIVFLQIKLFKDSKLILNKQMKMKMIKNKYKLIHMQKECVNIIQKYHKQNNNK